MTFYKNKISTDLQNVHELLSSTLMRSKDPILRTSLAVTDVISRYTQTGDKWKEYGKPTCHVSGEKAREISLSLESKRFRSSPCVLADMK